MPSKVLQPVVPDDASLGYRVMVEAFWAAFDRYKHINPTFNEATLIRRSNRGHQMSLLNSFKKGSDLKLSTFGDLIMGMPIEMRLMFFEEINDRDGCIEDNAISLGEWVTQCHKDWTLPATPQIHQCADSSFYLDSKAIDSFVGIVNTSEISIALSTLHLLSDIIHKIPKKQLLLEKLATLWGEKDDIKIRRAIADIIAKVDETHPNARPIRETQLEIGKQRFKLSVAAMQVENEREIEAILTHAKDKPLPVGVGLLVLKNGKKVADCRTINPQLEAQILERFSIDEQFAIRVEYKSAFIEKRFVA